MAPIKNIKSKEFIKNYNAMLKVVGDTVCDYYGEDKINPVEVTFCKGLIAKSSNNMRLIYEKNDENVCISYWKDFFKTNIYVQIFTDVIEPIRNIKDGTQIPPLSDILGVNVGTYKYLRDAYKHLKKVLPDRNLFLHIKDDYTLVVTDLEQDRDTKMMVQILNLIEDV